MHHFAYRSGVLHAEAVNLETLAEAVGTPFYCYSSATLTRHYRVFAAAFADVPALVCYAVKANSNQAVIATLAKLGAGADVVSGGELKRAGGGRRRKNHVLRHRQDRARTRVCGGRKHPLRECGMGRSSNCCLTLQAKGRTPISVRVNPDVDAGVHAKIATGRRKTNSVFRSAARESCACCEVPGISHRRRYAYRGRSNSRHSTAFRYCRILCAQCASTDILFRRRSRWRFGIPTATTMNRRPIPTPMLRWSRRATRGSTAR